MTYIPSQLGWAVVAALSVVSSRWILHDMGFHYPCYLLLCQLGVTLLANIPHIGLYLLRGQRVLLPLASWSVCRLTRSCILAIASICIMQATLHVRNLPTIAMVSLVCYTVEEVVAQLPNLYYACVSRRHVYVLVIAVGCALSLATDYHITPAGLLYATLGGVLVGLAMGLTPQDVHGFGPVDSIQLSTCGLIAAGIGVFLKEPLSLTEVRPVSLDKRWILHFLINITSSALVLGARGSVVAVATSSSALRCQIVPLSLVGLTGLAGSTVFVQRSHTTVFQLCSFITALYTLLRLKEDRPASTRPAVVDASTPRTRHYAVHNSISSRPLGNGDGRPSRFLLVALYTAVAWQVLLSAGLRFPPYLASTSSAPSAMLDTSLDIVISMYQEPIDAVTSLTSSLLAIPSLSNATIHIYTKYADADLLALQQQTGSHNITLLPNVGRESDTYLHHILTRWDDLARHTLFVQAQVHNKPEFLWRLRTFFDPRSTGMLDLGFRGHSYRCSGSDLWGWSDESGIVAQLYEEVYHTPCRDFLLTYKGQFVVSARRIRRTRKSVYNGLYQALHDPHSWAHHQGYVQGRADNTSAPVFGYTIERLWGVIFQCSDPIKSWQCPSFLAGMWAVGSKTECQCID